MSTLQDVALSTVGDTQPLPSFKLLNVDLRWHTDDDLDLMAVYEPDAGEPGLVYFGDQGDLDWPPYMALSDDETGSEGDNVETLQIARLEGMKRVWLICLDYGFNMGEGVVLSSASTRLLLTPMGGGGLGRIELKLASDSPGNLAVLGMLDWADGVVRVTNVSRVATLHGLESVEQILAVLRD